MQEGGAKILSEHPQKIKTDVAIQVIAAAFLYTTSATNSV